MTRRFGKGTFRNDISKMAVLAGQILFSILEKTAITLGSHQEAEQAIKVYLLSKPYVDVNKKNRTPTTSFILIDDL
jgi:hypothetical protein